MNHYHSETFSFSPKTGNLADELNNRQPQGPSRLVTCDVSRSPRDSARRDVIAVWEVTGQVVAKGKPKVSVST